ncbi:MAG: family 10 glycosylhydrolase, partial [Planctomycetes bacterium]|nr:family 10 glycosylhydrolase [Planctomycetota bacterium]
SKLEPWSAEYNFRFPGFDPLETAVQHAHANGLKIHAWCNVLTGWKGKKQPPADHLFAKHRDWFVHDEAGGLQPVGDFYYSLNPALPAVRAHLLGVFEEIVTRYDVDGLQLDYVRYVLDQPEKGRERFPRDPWTLALFQRQTGRVPDDDRNGWLHWRAAQVTELVTAIHDMAANRRPNLMLSASVWASPFNGYRDYMQNAVCWLNLGLLDAVFTMTYMDDLTRFTDCVDEYRRACPGGRVIPGIGLYKHETADETAAQLAFCRTWTRDLACYSYESLFELPNERLSAKAAAKTAQQRDRRRSAILDALQR